MRAVLKTLAEEEEEEEVGVRAAKLHKDTKPPTSNEPNPTRAEPKIWAPKVYDLIDKTFKAQGDEDRKEKKWPQAWIAFKKLTDKESLKKNKKV